MTSKRRATSNQHWNRVVHINDRICNVKQRRINVAYFGVDFNNVKQQRFHFQRRFLQRWATLKQCCEYDHLLKIEKYTSSQEHNNISEFQIKIISIEYFELKIYFTLFPISRDICRKIFANPWKFLKHCEYTVYKRNI